LKCDVCEYRQITSPCVTLTFDVGFAGHLDSLFNTLKKHGSSFPVEFWDTVCQELLFPIFAVLKSSQDLSRFSTQEDMSVWLSTTMIQALRDLIDLYTFYFDILERFLDGLLDLLCVCICQGTPSVFVLNV
jgi:brefeldin A-inhibited guanine nucleotide-exchange protein